MHGASWHRAHATEVRRPSALALASCAASIVCKEVYACMVAKYMPLQGCSHPGAAGCSNEPNPLQGGSCRQLTGLALDADAPHDLGYAELGHGPPPGRRTKRLIAVSQLMKG
eukprot:363200-Chlamydomonas_euryale.AAC.10